MLLHERARAAAPGDAAIAERPTTNAIALADFFALTDLAPPDVDQKNLWPYLISHPRTHLQDPTIAKNVQPTVHAAVLIGSFGAASRKSNALVLQAAQALPVLAVDDARAPCREADCGERGMVGTRRGGTKRSASESVSHWSTLRTETASREEVEQAITPIAFPIGTNWTIQGILVTAYYGH